MINEGSVAAVDASRWQDQFVKPLYRSYCFSRIPSLIESLLASEADRSAAGELLGPLARQYQKVILLFVDGYGWRFLRETIGQYPFLNRFALDGMVTKLTSQFPSTTSVHVTTIHTGLDVGSSGIYEWFMWEPSLESIITTLPFSYAGQLEPGTLVKDGVHPETIFPTETLYRRLTARGVRSHIWGSKEFTPSPVTDAIAAGSETHPFGTLREGLQEVADAIGSDDDPGYYFLYAGNIDAAGHKSGPNSPEWATEATNTFEALEEILIPALRGRTDTILLMTADHGQIECDPEKTILVNRIYPELARWFQTTSNGTPILPTGNFRDMVLHVQPEHLEKAHEELQDRLSERALVVPVEELITQGFFADVTERLTHRIGNLMVLPYGNALVWWEGYSMPQFRGYHGGLSPQEMETELLSWSPAGM